MNKSKILLAIGIAALVASFFYFDLDKQFSFEAIKQKQTEFAGYYAAHPARTQSPSSLLL